MIDPLRDPQDAEPAAYCHGCGGEMYAGETMFEVDGQRGYILYPTWMLRPGTQRKQRPACLTDSQPALRASFLLHCHIAQRLPETPAFAASKNLKTANRLRRNGYAVFAK